jgi:hypothetical protein
MNNNDLTSLPVDAFKYNTEFREIWLHDNALTSLPADAFKYNTELWYLLLNNNDLTSRAMRTVTGSKESTLSF